MTGLELIKQDALGCEWDAAQYLIISAEVDPLVYYSHLFPAVAALILAGIVIFNNRSLLTSKLFLGISVLFAFFAVFDLILWATENPSLIMFFWSLLTYIEPVIYALVLYLVYVFAWREDVPLRAKIIVGVLLAPIFILGPTHLNIVGFDYADCWRLAVEGPLATYYVYTVEIIFVIWLLVAALRAYKVKEDRRKPIMYMTVGTLLFLVAFSSGNIFGTLLQPVLGEDAWIIGQYGLFGMPIFLGFILYLIVKFKAFTARMFGAEALILSLWILLLALLFLNDVHTARIVIIATLLLFAMLGSLLIRSIRREIKQRQEIERLAGQLQKANDRLKILDKMKSEFVSIASHQLRSPLTSIRGYASMLLEGSYGKLPAKSKEAVQRIADSSRYMALSVEDYLNVSRIESGSMKYEDADFNVKEVSEKIVDEMRPAALKKGLLLTSKSDCSGSCSIHADIGKVRQVIMNLVDNSMKYTPKGSITVIAHDDIKKKKMYITIQDTGVGMSKEMLEDVFDKFVRAKNANEINVTGTGLGLFVAKKMVSEMGGKIWAESEGEGKGSAFHVEFPLLPGKYRG